MEAPDPALPQRRIATTPSGRQVWPEITSADRLTCIDSFPGRWPEILKARESGVPFDKLAGTVHMSREEFSDALAAAYTILETMLHDVAQRRARLMP